MCIIMDKLWETFPEKCFKYSCLRQQGYPFIRSMLLIHLEICHHSHHGKVIRNLSALGVICLSCLKAKLPISCLMAERDVSTTSLTYIYLLYDSHPRSVTTIKWSTLVVFLSVWTERVGMQYVSVYFDVADVINAKWIKLASIVLAWSFTTHATLPDTDEL